MTTSTWSPTLSVSCRRFSVDRMRMIQIAMVWRRVERRGLGRVECKGAGGCG